MASDLVPVAPGPPGATAWAAPSAGFADAPAARAGSAAAGAALLFVLGGFAVLGSGLVLARVATIDHATVALVWAVLVGGAAVPLGIVPVQIASWGRRLAAAAMAGGVVLVGVIANEDIGPYRMTSFGYPIDLGHRAGSVATALVLVALAALGAGLVWQTAARPRPGPIGYAPLQVPGGPLVAVPVAPRSNGFAIASLVLGIFGAWLLAVVFGFIGLSQVRSSGGQQTGRGLAIAGIVLGFGWLVLWVALYALVAVAASST